MEIQQQFQILVQGFSTGYRLGYTEDDAGAVTFHTVKPSYFFGYKKKKDLECKKVFQKVHEFFLEHRDSLQEHQLSYFEKKLEERKKCLQNRLTSWWRRLFMWKTTQELLAKRIRDIEILAKVIFNTTHPDPTIPEPQVRESSPLPPKPEEPIKLYVPASPPPLPLPPPPPSATCGKFLPPPPPPPNQVQALTPIFEKEELPEEHCLIKSSKTLEKMQDQELEQQIEQLKGCKEKLEAFEEQLALPTYLKKYEKLNKDRRSYDTEQEGHIPRTQEALQKAQNLLRKLLLGKEKGTPVKEKDVTFFPDCAIDAKLDENPSDEDQLFLKRMSISEAILATERKIKKHDEELSGYIGQLNAIIGTITDFKKSHTVPFKKWQEVQSSIDERKELYDRRIKQRNSIIKNRNTKKFTPQEESNSPVVRGPVGQNLRTLKGLKYMAAARKGIDSLIEALLR